MAVELECGSCGRRMQVEVRAGIVVCPHCRIELQIPEPVGTNPAFADLGDGLTQPAIAAAECATDIEAESPSQFAFLELDEDSSPVPLDSSVFPGFPVGVDNVPERPLPRAVKPPPQLSGPPAATGDVSGNNEPATEFIGPTRDESPAPSAARGDVIPVTQSVHPRTDVPSATDRLPLAVPANAAPPSAAPGVPRFMFVMLAGYASAVTLALIWLWWVRGRVHPLESLPDVVPEKTSYIIDESIPLPPKYTLRLGDTQRYGNLAVTPLRVTRGPAVVVAAGHEGMDDPALGESSLPVLKLWLRLRNVSAGQTFRPFGRELLRLPGPNDRFNTFVCRPDQKHKDGERVLVYDLWQDRKDLALLGQHVDRELGPKESCETYIATSTLGIDELKGDLVWRVHFRKGLNPKTRRGVTTLIEIAFHSNDVQDEPHAIDE